MCKMIITWLLLIPNLSSAKSNRANVLLESQIVAFAQATTFHVGDFIGWKSGNCVFSSKPNLKQAKIFIIERVQIAGTCQESLNFTFGGEREKPANHYDFPSQTVIDSFKQYIQSVEFKTLTSYRDIDGHLAVDVINRNRVLTLKKDGDTLWLRGQYIDAENEQGPGAIDFICDFSFDIDPNANALSLLNNSLIYSH